MRLTIVVAPERAKQVWLSSTEAHRAPGERGRYAVQSGAYYAYLILESYEPTCPA